MAEKEWDMTVPCGDGMITVRVGAIIMKNGKILMVQGEHDDYLYTVGGRVKFGETADDAIVREVWEETGVRLEIDRLGFVHENYFYGDSASNRGKVIYEISFFYYMKVPEDFEPASADFHEGESVEHLRWVAPDDPIRKYPLFFSTELVNPSEDLKHLVTDQRVKD